MSSEVSSRLPKWVSDTGAGKTKLRVIQAVVFCVVIAAVWGLVVAIEVIYHLPQVINFEIVTATPPPPPPPKKK